MGVVQHTSYVTFELERLLDTLVRFDGVIFVCNSTSLQCEKQHQRQQQQRSYEESVTLDSVVVVWWRNICVCKYTSCYLLDVNIVRSLVRMYLGGCVKYCY